MIQQFKGKHNFLSNFYRVKLIIDGEEYPSTEHYFQSMKFTDPKIREEIRTTSTPGQSKKLARQYNTLVREDWFDISLEVMEKALKSKFSIPKLKEKLLSTGEVELQEGNTWHDTFWGVDLKTGKGDNHLGILLMKIRDEFQQE